ncbi:uncharacterized protein V3H82_015913 [Fundulus diaphanus]
MKHLYVPLLLIIVSGDMDVNITGYLRGDVLLQCDCKGMDQAKGFKWQIKTNKFFCYQFSSPRGMSSNCTRHIESFLNDSIDSCAIRLTNITEDDSGTYMCLFTRMNYNRNIFYLEVNMTSLPPEVSTTPPHTVKSRHSTEISTSRDHLWICFTVPAVLLLSGCIWTVLRRRRRNPPQEAVN